MKKIVFLQFLSCIAINSFAQIPKDSLCPFREISISRQTKHIDAISYYDVIDVPQQKSNAYRNIFFIHGLGGDVTAWLKAADACENLSGFARKCFTHRLDYTKVTDNPINVAAHEVGQQIKDVSEKYASDIQSNTAILIAHSQGGVVCRELMHKDFVEKQDYALGKYGGVVTVASPLQGAMILNNRYLIHSMANDACHALTTDILTVSIVGSIVLPIILPILTANGIPTPTPGVICDVVTGPVLGSFASNYYDKITDAYVVDGCNSKIKTYNADANNAEYCKLPKVAFYGVEPQENILWRTAQWMKDNPNDEAHFGANNDMKFYNNVIKPVYIAYSVGSMVNDMMYDIADKTFKWTWWCCPVSASTALMTMMTSAAVKPLVSRGRNWFEGANAQWQTVIGAKTYNSQTGRWDIKENDGVVLTESAMNLPCATNISVRIGEQGEGWAGSSHMQIRNDSGIDRALNNLFNGNYGRFFEIPQKK
jgi:hypothetical protein